MSRNSLKVLIVLTLTALMLLPPVVTLITYATSVISPQPVTPTPVQTPPKEPTITPSPSTPVVVPNNPGSQSNTHHIVVVPPSTQTNAKENKPGSGKSTSPIINPSPPIVVRKAVLSNTTGGARESFENYKVAHLITGDIVLFTKVKGKYIISVKPAEPGERFYTVIIGGHLYVIPSSVNLKKFDISLFDVTYLAKYYSKLSKLPVIVELSEKVKVTPVSVMRRITESVKGAHGTAFTIIKGFALEVPISELHKAYVALATNPYIERVVLDRIVKVASEPITVSDFRAALYNSTKLVGAQYSWSLGVNGTGVRVAILDTGIDPTHPDFYFPNGTSKIVANRSFVDFNFDGIPDENITDLFGHGTHCAGIIAGTGRASNGSIKGVAPGALLVVGKVLSNYGWGYESWIINGIEWAVKENASIISMSLGGPPVIGYDPLEDAVKNATEQGVLVVIAAGNEGPQYFTVDSPGVTPQALTVAAVSKYLYPAWFTSVGPTVKLQLKPDIAAPGVMIASARANHTFMGPPASKYYIFASGTSMATPHVAGLAALVEQAIKIRERSLGQQVPTGPEDLKYMLMSYASPLPYSPLQVGIGFANVTDLVSALTNTSKYVIYVEPPYTVTGESGIQNVTFTIKVLPGTEILNKELYIAVTPELIPWLGAYVNISKAIIGVTPSVISLNVTNLSQVITLKVAVTVNWSALPAGFHTLLLDVASTYTNSSKYVVVRGMTGLFKLQHMSVTVTSKNYSGVSGIVVIVPEFPCSPYVPQVFQFNELPVTINVPVVIPGVTYDIGVAASAPNMLITTAYMGNTFTSLNETNFNYTIDIDQQLSSGLLRSAWVENPFTSPGLSTPAFIASQLRVGQTTVLTYTFTNLAYLIMPPSTIIVNDNITIDPALTVLWPDNSGNLRIYEALHQIPFDNLSASIFYSKPNFEAEVILRTIGDQPVYIPLNLITVSSASISPQYGFLTPKVVNVLIYCNYPEEVEGIYTPAIIYVFDNSGNEVGYIIFDNVFLDYGIFYGTNTTETDPLRMPYGTTVWLSDVSSWKGIDAQDYIVGEEYVRFLDSWWDTGSLISSYTILYINGKEVLVSPDNDPGVYTYGWASIGNDTVAKVLFDSHATLSWAGDYVYFMKDMSVEYNVTMENLPAKLVAGVPAYTIADAFYLEIPGYGVRYIAIDPLTLGNIVPRNLTDVANVTMILGIPPLMEVPGKLTEVSVSVINASGYPLLTANITNVQQIDYSDYLVQASFSTMALPTGEYGIEVMITSTYNVTSVYNTTIPVTIRYDYRAYPAMKLEPLVLRPIYVGYAPYCNFTSIQDAINYAYPNQTIYVLPGTYFINKPIIITKPLKIIGLVINGSEPLINTTTYLWPAVIYIDNAGSVELANLTIFAGTLNPGERIMYPAIIRADNSYKVGLSGINIITYEPYQEGPVLGSGIFLWNVVNASLNDISIEIPATNNFGANGIYIYTHQPIQVSLSNVRIDENFEQPLFINSDPEFTALRYSNVYVNEEGTLVPLVIYRYVNAGSISVVPASRYVFYLARNTSIVFRDAKVEWISGHGIVNTNVTLDSIEFLNRTYPTIIEMFADNIALNNVRYLQPLVNGVHTSISTLELHTYRSSTIRNSVLSAVWIYQGVIHVYNTTVYVVPNSFGLYGHFVNELIVSNSSIKGLSTTSKGTLGIYVMELTSPTAVIKVVNSTFTDLVYGIVLPSGVSVPVIKDNTFINVDVPITLLPPGTTPSWLGIVLGTSRAKWINELGNVFLIEASTPSNITSSEVISGIHSSNSTVLIYSNTFINSRTCINASNLMKSSVMIVNNTFIQLDNYPGYTYLNILNASLTGIWLNTFKSSTTLILTLGSNVTYVNYNNFLATGIVLNTSSTYLLDIRWNYLQCQSSTQCSMSIAGNPQYVRSSSLYAKPLPLPLKHLIPVVMISAANLPGTVQNYVITVPQGGSTKLRLDFINPYDTNLTYSYEVKPALGVNVSDHELIGNHTLGPVFVSSAESNVSLLVRGESPGTSAVYVLVDDFRYVYPIEVLPIKVRVSITAPETALRGAKIPITLTVSSPITNSTPATLLVTLSKGAEVTDPVTYRGASTLVIPVTLNGTPVVIRLNVTSLFVGNVTIRTYVYALNELTPINYTERTVAIMPNPNVEFNVSAYLGSNVTVNSFTYLEVVVKGDPNYSLLLNVTVTTQNKDVLALGYEGNESVFNQVVRTDPYARIAYVYVPIKGVSAGNASVEIKAVSIGDGVMKTVLKVIEVKPLTAWGFVSNITSVSNEFNESSMSLTYPNTTTKAWLNLTIYSSKLSVSYNALNNLIGVPWGCVEQTTSPLLSDIEVYRYITQRNLWDNVSQAINRTLLEEYIREGVQRLLNYHLTCNATNCWFGWYPGLSPTKFFTIYGTLGLLEAYKFAYVDYRQWYGNTFNLGVDVQQLNESIAKLLKTIIEMRNPQGYWSYPAGQVDYISDSIPLTSMAVYVLSKAVSLGYLPANMSLGEVKEVIQQAVNWLERTQLSDGGWAPDPGESISCPYATAYVLRALAASAEAGVAVNVTVISNAIDFLNSTAEGSTSFKYWEPVMSEWNSWWGMDKYLTTAEVVIALAELNRTSLSSTIPVSEASLMNELSNQGARFLILTASEWIDTWNTYEGSAILAALNSVATDLSFSQPLTVNVTILLNGRDAIFSKNYTLTGRYSYITDGIFIGKSLLSQGKLYVVKVTLLSGEGEAVVVAYSWYEYIITSSSKTSSVAQAPYVRLAKESRYLMNSETTIVLDGKVYHIEQASVRVGNSEPGIELTQEVSTHYVTKGMPVRVTITVKPVNTTSIFGVVMTEKVPTGFEAMVNLSSLGNNVAFDEQRFNASGGLIIKRTNSTLLLAGGELAFAIQAVGENGVKIQYLLIPVNVSEGKVTLPEVYAWVFYSPLGKRISSTLRSTQTLTIGMPFSASVVSEVMYRGVTLGNNSVLKWGDRVKVIVNLPKEINVTLVVELMSNESTYLSITRSTSGGTETINIDTLALAKYVKNLSNSYVDVVIKVVKGGNVISQKAVKVYFSKVSRYDLFKRMIEIEREYMQAPASEKSAIESNEVTPLTSIWGYGR